MAGIGFKIQKLLAEDTYWGVVKGYFYSAVISSGPWLISILCIGTLGILYQPMIGHDEHQVFRAWVTYCYAASLVISGAVQVVVTRYVADCIFKHEDEDVFSSFITVSALLFAFQFGTGFAYLEYHGFEREFVYGGAFLYGVISEIWIAMIYLSAAKDYITIVLAYIVGAVLSVACSWYLVRLHDVLGLLYGYSIGQTILLAILASRIFVEFPIGSVINFECLKVFYKTPSLILIGLSYNGAIWIDKLLFWIYQGTEIRRGLYSCPFYETPAFLAFVTIVPTLAIFLIRIETSFYSSYRIYYQKVTNKASYSEVLKSKKEMLESLYLSFYRLLLFQGIITAISIALVPQIIIKFQMETIQQAVLRITILGAFLHALLMVLLIIILYFDWKGLALQVNVIFFVTNFLFTRLTLELDLSYQGYGYFFACLVSVLYGALKFFDRFHNLEYITFTSQPLGGLSWNKHP